MRIVGVDEAGRGPVLGPLVVGLLSIPSTDEDMLIEQNISDSKHHTAKQREEQYEWILQQAEERDWYVDTIVCPPNKIDQGVAGEGLNILEVDLFASILNRHNKHHDTPCNIMLDACDVNEQRFTNRITTRMTNWPRKIRPFTPSIKQMQIIELLEVPQSLQKSFEIESWKRCKSHWVLRLEVVIRPTQRRWQPYQI